MTASIIYEGQFHCQATHNQSGSSIETDAPTDNKGKGERFSPTDLVCVALSTCIITTMALKAADMNIVLDGAKVETQKHMASNPRRIAKIEVFLTMPSQLQLSEKDRTILENTGNTCPVHQALKNTVEMEVHYTW
jgi:putative redox protein